MEDKNSNTNSNWYQQCIKHCEAFGISKAIIELFFHLQEQKHEQNYEEAKDCRL